MLKIKSYGSRTKPPGTFVGIAEAQLYVSGEVIVVGGGNAAGQADMYLSQAAGRIAGICKHTDIKSLFRQTVTTTSYSELNRSLFAESNPLLKCAVSLP